MIFKINWTKKPFKKILSQNRKSESQVADKTRNHFLKLMNNVRSKVLSHNSYPRLKKPKETFPRTGKNMSKSYFDMWVKKKDQSGFSSKTANKLKYYFC